MHKKKITRLRKQVIRKKKVNRNKTANCKTAQIIELSSAVLLVLFVVIPIVSVFLFCHITTSIYSKEVSDNIKVPLSTTLSGTVINIPVQKSVGKPVRIIIPSINVDASIEKLGLKADGSMDVPKDPMNTGWYELGPRPGEIGSAVLDGHVDWWYGAPAVFPDLYKLKIDDKIIVEDEFGLYISFVVRGIKNYGATADATNIFVSNDGMSHLNLITCSGAWITVQINIPIA